MTGRETREQKARALIDAGAIRLHPGKGYATVRGATGTYTVTRQDGCNCEDAKRRDPKGCKHAISVRILCGIYRALAAKARAGETVRIPADLLKAIGGVRADEESAPAPTGALIDAYGVAYCHDCGTDLVDGRCPGRDWVERAA